MSMMIIFAEQFETLILCDCASRTLDPYAITDITPETRSNNLNKILENKIKGMNKKSNLDMVCKR